MAILVIAVALLLLALSPLLLERLERAMISTGPNGPMTPAAVGLAYERIKIGSEWADHGLLRKSSG